MMPGLSLREWEEVCQANGEWEAEDGHQSRGCSMSKVIEVFGELQGCKQFGIVETLAVSEAVVWEMKLASLRFAWPWRSLDSILQVMMCYMIDQGEKLDRWKTKSEPHHFNVTILLTMRKMKGRKLDNLFDFLWTEILHLHLSVWIEMHYTLYNVQDIPLSPKLMVGKRREI